MPQLRTTMIMPKGHNLRAARLCVRAVVGGEALVRGSSSMTTVGDGADLLDPGISAMFSTASLSVGRSPSLRPHRLCPDDEPTPRTPRTRSEATNVKSTIRRPRRSRYTDDCRASRTSRSEADRVTSLRARIEGTAVGSVWLGQERRSAGCGQPAGDGLAVVGLSHRTEAAEADGSAAQPARYRMFATLPAILAVCERSREICRSGYEAVRLSSRDWMDQSFLPSASRS